MDFFGNRNTKFRLIVLIFLIVILCIEVIGAFTHILNREQITLISSLAILCALYIGFSIQGKSKGIESFFVLSFLVGVLNTGVSLCLIDIYPVQFAIIVNSVVVIVFGLYDLYKNHKGQIQ